MDENDNVREWSVFAWNLGNRMLPAEDVPWRFRVQSSSLRVDTVIMALGTSPNPLISSTTIGLDTNRRKCIIADETTGQTSKEGVFAGGDAVTGAATVILAMGAGKAAAKGIHDFLSSK